MPFYFKDRIPDPIHGENTRYYDAVGNNGTVKLSDFKLTLKNNIPAGKTGDPVSAANLNYASGIVSLAANIPADIHKGSVVSLERGGASLMFPARNAAASGLDISSSMFKCGCIRLSDTRYLILYHNSIVVATVNFTAKTVTFGTAMAIGVTNASSFSLIQNADENPTRAIVAIDNGSDTVNAFAINGTAITSIGSYVISSSYVDGTLSNLVPCGNSTALLVTRHNQSQTLNIYLLDFSGSVIAIKSQTSKTGVNANAYFGGLYSYDSSKTKHVLIYTNASNLCALPISLSGTAITAGTVQTVGTAAETVLTSNDKYAANVGTNMYTDGGGKIALFGNSAGSGVYGPIKMQMLSVNSSGIVTRGSIVSLPLMNSSAITQQGGGIGLTFKSASKIYLTGIDYDVTPRDSCLIEYDVNGVVLSAAKKSRPFRVVKSANDTSAINGLKAAALENPGKSGEFLFMQHYGTTPLINLNFWFGNISDNANPNNIAGIVVEEPENGYVKTQTSGKYLQGIASGLNPGQLYMAGTNGTLAPYTGASGTKAIGVAASATDFCFFGATGLS